MKPLKAKVKLHIKAGQANPGPPLGPALAQHGINLSDFCQKFNDATKDKSGLTVPVEVKIYEDRTFEMDIKTPLTSDLIKKEIGIDKGSGEPNRKKVGTISKDQLKRVAQEKLPDLNTNDIEKAIKIVAGTAKSMGLEVKM